MNVNKLDLVVTHFNTRTKRYIDDIFTGSLGHRLCLEFH